MGSSKLIITMRIGDDCCYSLYPTLYLYPTLENSGSARHALLDFTQGQEIWMYVKILKSL